jgi:hypothetical protein
VESVSIAPTESPANEICSVSEAIKEWSYNLHFQLLEFSRDGSSPQSLGGAVLDMPLKAQGL